jgi:hypothetical protein
MMQAADFWNRDDFADRLYAEDLVSPYPRRREGEICGSSYNTRPACGVMIPRSRQSRGPNIPDLLSR